MTSLHVRDAFPDDIAQMHSWVCEQAVSAKLLPLTRHQIQKNLDRFLVLCEADSIIGCGALEIYNQQLCELRTIVINKQHQGKGGGRVLIAALEARARDLNIEKIMALTFVPNFFHKIGYQTIERSLLPEKIWRVCIRCPKFFLCDEVAVMKILK